MYEGNNPTALNSREWLINAFLALMETKPYSKITVKDICQKADLSRQTFYNFFETKDNIILFCIKRCYLEMMDELKARSPLSLSDITEECVKTFHKNQNMIHLIISQNLEYLLEIELASVIQIFAEQVNPEIGDHSNKYGTAFLTGAIAHTVIYWFKDTQPISSEQLAELLTNILSGNYYVIKDTL
ncbi:MAG: TetR/AcrR family transcriptional regulator C-terminal domain-containing protein [Lachnospiraceae bacterium]|nr:TetR/AcrR family transcriptional regulator C-terminal domain-containing protein [Lachnospiraceae bacterium]